MVSQATNLFNGDLVALIRRACGIDTTLSTYDATVRRNFQGRGMNHHAGVGVKFNEVQM